MRTASTRAPPRRARPCCRTWSRPSAVGTCAAGCGHSRTRCTSAVWPARWSSFRHGGGAGPGEGRPGGGGGAGRGTGRLRDVGRTTSWSRTPWSRAAASCSGAGQDASSEEDEDAGGGRVPACSRLTVLLALRGARPGGTVHRTLVHRADAPGQPLTVLRPDDPALRPDAEHESAVLSVPVRTEEIPGDGDAERLADQLLAAADAAGPELSGRVLWREVRTPEDTVAETGSRGSGPGAGARGRGRCAWAQPDAARALQGGRLGTPGRRARARRDVGRAGGRTDHGRRGLARLPVNPRQRVREPREAAVREPS